MTNAEHIAQLKAVLFDTAAKLLVAENCAGVGYSIPGTKPEQLVLIGELPSLKRYMEIRADKKAL